MTRRGFWSFYARLYDDIWESPLTREVARGVARAAGVGPGARVVDLGCGTGLISRELGHRGALVTGVDADRVMLARASGRLAHAVEADAAATGLDPQSWDAVVAVNLVHVHPDPAAVLAEMRRLLRPGGVAVLVWPSEGVSVGRLFRVERRLGRGRLDAVRAAVLRVIVAIPALGARVAHHPDVELAGIVRDSGLEVAAEFEAHGVQRVVWGAMG